MAPIHPAGSFSDDVRRQRLFAGDLFQFTALDSVRRLCGFARSLAEGAFGDLDPQTSQFAMPVEAFVDVIGPLKRTFTNHPDTRQMVQAVLREAGCDLETTYFDVPRLRVVSAQGYLTAGMGYAYKLHRDPWYSSPSAQFNFWIPVYDVVAERTLALYPDYFSQPVANSSDGFDYGEWVAVGRQAAATMVTSDTRNHPLPLESIDRSHCVRFVGKQDTAFLFAGSHLHETAPNTSPCTRFSMDFRLVNADDLEAGRGGPNVDGRARGTTLGDFVRASDFTHLPASLIDRYFVRR